MGYVLITSKNVPLTPDYKNVMRFTGSDPVAAKNQFLTEYFGSHFNVTSFYHKVNFNYGDGVVTSCTYNIEDLAQEGYDPNEDYDRMLNIALNANYLHYIPNLPEGNEEFISRFYFITSAKSRGNSIVEYTLELDIFMTYSFSIGFKDKLFVERKHCDRITRTAHSVPPAAVYDDYMLLADEDALAADDIDSKFEATKVKSITQLKLQYTGSSVFTDWLNSTFWLYIWISDDSDSLWDISSGSKSRYYFTFAGNGNTQGNNYRSSMHLVVAPFKGMQLHDAGTSTTTTWSAREAMLMFGSNANVISIQVSPVAPFMFAFWDDDFSQFGSITNDVLVIETLDGVSHGARVFSDFDYLKYFKLKTAVSDGSSTYSRGILLAYWKRDDAMISQELAVPVKARHCTVAAANFPTNSESLDPLLEPKLKTTPYFRYGIKAQYFKETFMNALQLVFCSKSYFTATMDRLQVNMYHVPDVTDDVYFMSFNVTNSNSPYYYSKAAGNNGLKEVLNYSLPTMTDAFKEYLNTHKNFMISGLMSMASAGSAGGIVGAAAGAAGSAVGAAAGAIWAGAKFAVQISDLKQTPDQVKFTGISLLHDIEVGNLVTPYIIEYELLEDEKQQVLTYYARRGYQVNKAVNYSDCFGRTRFNFIKTSDDTLVDKLIISQPFEDGAIEISSNLMKRKVADAFNNGITFWNYVLDADEVAQPALHINDQILDTSKENYEVAVIAIPD